MNLQRIIERFDLKGKYLTFTVENPMDGVEDLFNVSVEEALHEIARHGDLQNICAPADILNKYADVKGWKTRRHYVGLGNNG